MMYGDKASKANKESKGEAFGTLLVPIHHVTTSSLDFEQLNGFIGTRSFLALVIFSTLYLVVCTFSDQWGDIRLCSVVITLKVTLG